jgi:hypothetical protein
MKAIIIKIAEDEGSSTVVKVNGILYEAMDCLGYSGVYDAGDEVEIEFSIGSLYDEETWGDMFNGNPHKEFKLVNTEGWSYRAYGEIVSLNPVLVHCGIEQFEGVLATNDERCIGAFIAFNIQRLDVCQKTANPALKRDA